MADEQEGWGVPLRKGVLIGVAFPLVLLVLLIGTGFLYQRTLLPRTEFGVTPLPAPGLETTIHDGADDPKRKPVRARPDPAIERAKAETVAEGLPGWKAR